MNSQQNVVIVKKNKEIEGIQVNENYLVYKKMKEIHDGDNDILVVSEKGVVCYFDESFSQFKNRISKGEDLFIVVESLKEIYNQLIDNQTKFEECKKAYELLQDNVRDQLFSQIQEEKLQFQIISSDGNSTTFNSTIFEKKFHNQTMEKLLEVVTELKQIKSIPSSKLCQSEIEYDTENTSEVISLINTCYFCNTQKDNKRIQLNCYHKFHEDCLVSLFFGQLQNQHITQLSCLCKITHKPSILQNIQDQNSQILLRHKLLQNQVNAIVQNYKLEKCQKPSCYFYFKMDDKLQLNKSYCPLCLC